jgi:hypothetical protein
MEQQKKSCPSFCPSRINPAVSMRLITELGPAPRRAGRYWGSFAKTGVAEDVPPGRDVAEGDPAGRGVAEGDAEERAAGVGEGFTCTCTSAAKSVMPVRRAATVDDQNLSMTAYATQCSPFRKVNLARLKRESFARKDRSLLPHSALTAPDKPI